GFSPALATSLALYSTDEISGQVLPNRLYDSIRNIASDIEQDNLQPVVYLKDGIPKDFHAFALYPYEFDDSYESIRFSTLSEATAYYFINRESSNTIRQKSKDLLRVTKSQLDKLRLKVQRLNEDLYRAENSDKYRLYGELLTANLHTVKPGDRQVIVTSYYDNSQVKIPLDPKYSPARNAQNYYKKYGKAKTAIKEKKLQLTEAASEIEYLESVESFIERANSIEELGLLREELVESGYLRNRKQSKASRRGNSNKRSKPKPHSYTLSSGMSVLVGRNNSENDWLTFKKASSSDIWLHTKDIHGSHAILLTEGRTPTEDDLFEAASIAAFHSKGNTSENVPVDYTKVRYVKKPTGSKPGFVIFTHNRTLYVRPALPNREK
ncbi:MAG: NFACT family protein, partial [Bacillota bacterium]|nr:NFACT family protein [Bacillota bacterium]